MKTKPCSMCNIEKHIKNFNKKYTECKNCHRTRGVYRYENKDKISIEQKIYNEKK